MRLLLVTLSLFIMSFSSKPPISFWGPTGHRATGKIAEKYLKKSVKRKIDRLLNGQSLAFVSTYADEIKSDKKYNMYYPWHYVNMPFDQSYKEANKNPKGDIVTGIQHCITVLKDDHANKKEKAFFLKMLVHLIGDLHQPLHLGRAADKGGNTLQVQWFKKGTNLHKVWDEEMIDQWGMSYQELATNTQQLSKEEIKNIEKGSVIDWMNDTRKLTKKAYNSAKPGENLRYQYSYDYFPIVRQQLQKGGIRLAKLLNDIF